jgi:hypothetical protein
MGRARCRSSHALARQKSFGFNLTRGEAAFIQLPYELQQLPD